MANRAFSGPLALLILDGWGHREGKTDNGIALARKPYFDALWRDYPRALIDGSGPAVGLPQGIMGNSEVGHMNLGAGRIVYSGLSQIYQAIADGSFYLNRAFLKAVEQVKKNDSTLHLMGLVSDGAVHSHQDHLYALLDLAGRHQLKKVVVHCFLDGRDTPPHDGVKYLRALQQKIKTCGVGEIASVMGRFFAMDRDKRWDRVAKAFHAICGKAVPVKDPLDYVQKSYDAGKGDEFIEPASVQNSRGEAFAVKPEDAFVFFNFRADRAREISRTFTEPEFSDFDRQGQPLPAVFVGASPYEKSLKMEVAFEPSYPQKILPEILAQHQIKQLRIAETEKYAHVTFFFNGGRDLVFEGEDRVLIPSPREVATYDLKPEMSAFEVRDELLKRLAENKYGVVICNFANTDMVGHTAVPQAVVKAVETVDVCISAVVDKVLELDGAVIVTADHGNAEEMRNAKGEPMTAHTTNLVPFILVGKAFKDRQIALRDHGRLCDVAPTMLKLLDLPQPKEMTGESLIP